MNTTDVVYEAPTLVDFVAKNAEAACTRYKDCCAVTGSMTNFDLASCTTSFASQGWIQSLTDVTVAGVSEGGRIAYDPAKGDACLAAIRNMTCVNTTATEYKNAWMLCMGAVTGLSNSGACRSNAECGTESFCDIEANGGTCTPLKAADESCSPSAGHCSHRHAGSSQCVDDGTGTYKCAAALANGTACYFDWQCASGACSVRLEDAGVVATCEDTTDILFGMCDAYP